jgi:hypothetical protein
MSTEKPPDKSTEEPVPTEITVDYIKSNLFRVIHADGAWGGLTARGTIHMALFSERPTIPQTQVLQVTNEGKLGPPIPEQTKKRPAELVREVEVEVIMSYETAQALHAWLEDKFNVFEKFIGPNAKKEGSR